MDRRVLYNLYQSSALNHLWPISFDDWETKLFDKDPKISVKVISKDEKGFLILKIKNKKASISLIVVSPEYQKQSIGSSLIQDAILYCKNKGIKEIIVGHGVGEYLWPGIPDNTNTKLFFSKNGFKHDWEPVDLVLDISNFKVPSSIFSRVNKAGFELRKVSSIDYHAISKFEKKHFPNWSMYFEELIQSDSKEKLAIIRNNNEICASTILFWDDYIFKRLFDGMVGGGEALGVAKTYRGKGLGLALKAFGMELLKEKGVKWIVVQYTSAPGFYEKLGFKEWQKYTVMNLDLTI